MSTVPWSAALLLAGLGLACVGSAAAQQESARAEGISFSEAVRAFNEGRDEEARKLFAEVVDEDASNGTAKYWLGLTYLRLGRATEAVDSIKASLRARRKPQVDPVWIRHDLGQAQLDAKDAASAAQTLQEVIAEAEPRVEQERREEPWLRRVRRRALAARAEALSRLGRKEEAAAVKEREGDLEGPEPGEGKLPPPEITREIRRLDKRASTGEQRLAQGDAEGAQRILDDVVENAEASLVKREGGRGDEALLRRSLLRYAAALESLNRPGEAASARARATELGLEPEPGLSAVIAPPWSGAPEVAREGRRWEGRAAVTGVSDSNPGQLSEALSLDTPGSGTELVSGTSSDTASTLDLRLAALPLQDAHGWSLTATLDGRQSFYQDFGSLDLGELR